jgi:uncharacterized protein (TIGR02444 family)
MPDAAAFWNWSLATWPKVERLALELQEAHGADVNLLLFCAWAGRLSAAELDAAEEAVAAWRREVLEPLRRARRGARGTPLHRRLESAELEAERIAQERIAAAVPKPLGQNDAVALYLDRLGAPERLRAAALQGFPRS